MILTRNEVIGNLSELIVVPTRGVGAAVSS
jgi:hypothetical protein